LLAYPRLARSGGEEFFRPWGFGNVQNSLLWFRPGDEAWSAARFMAERLRNPSRVPFLSFHGGEDLPPAAEGMLGQFSPARSSRALFLMSCGGALSDPHWGRSVAAMAAERYGIPVIAPRGNLDALLRVCEPGPAHEVALFRNRIPDAEAFEIFY